MARPDVKVRSVNYDRVTFAERIPCRLLNSLSAAQIVLREPNKVRIMVLQRSCKGRLVRTEECKISLKVFVAQ